MAAFAGLRGTGEFGADERPTNFRGNILWTNPNGHSPLFALTSQLDSIELDDPKHTWWEERHREPTLTVSTNYSDSATTIVLASGSADDLRMCRPNDVLMVRTVPTNGTAYTGSYYELLHVQSVTYGTNTIVVTRGFAGTTAAAMTSSTVLVRLGPAFEEGSSSAAVGGAVPSQSYNLCQIHKEAYSITTTAKKTKTRTGDPFVNDQMRAEFKIRSALERTMLYGVRSESVGPGNQLLRTSGGLTSFIPASNVIVAAAASWTPNFLLDTCTPLFRVQNEYVNNERMVFCGDGFLNNLGKNIENSGGASRFQYAGPLKVYGMEFEKYKTPHGTLAFKTHPLMSQDSVQRNQAIVFAPRALKYLYMRDLAIDKGLGGQGLQNNDADQLKHQWLAECSLRVDTPEAHALWQLT